MRGFYNSAFERFERASTPLFFLSSLFRVIGPSTGAGAGKAVASLSTPPVNRRSFVNTIHVIIEDATGWQRSVHMIFLFTSSPSFYQVLSLMRL
jgi:hypothetical protein